MAAFARFAGRCTSRATPEVYTTVKARLDERGIAYASFPTEVAESLFLADPNGLRIELNTEPKGYAMGAYIL